MHLGIVKYNEGVLLDCHGKPFKKVSDKFRGHGIRGGEPMIVAPVINHAENIEPFLSLRRDANILPRELPSVWHIPFGANVALIPKVEIDATFIILVDKLLQFLHFVCVELREGFPFGVFLIRPNLAPRLIKKTETCFYTPPFLWHSAIVLWLS